MRIQSTVRANCHIALLDIFRCSFLFLVTKMSSDSNGNRARRTFVSLEIHQLPFRRLEADHRTSKGAQLSYTLDMTLNEVVALLHDQGPRERPSSRTAWWRQFLSVSVTRAIRAFFKSFASLRCTGFLVCNPFFPLGCRRFLIFSINGRRQGDMSASTCKLRLDSISQGYSRVPSYE